MLYFYASESRARITNHSLRVLGEEATPLRRRHPLLSLSSYMALTFAVPDARRIRHYFQRLPLCTRGLLVVLTAFYIAHLFTPALNRWGALVPQEINLNTRTSTTLPHYHTAILQHESTTDTIMSIVYRLNTYPLLVTVPFFLGCGQTSST